MNLKFWKKKPENDAPENDSETASAMAGVFSRIKVQAAALTARFGSPPPFKAEVPAAEAEQPAGEDAPPAPESGPAGGAFARANAVLASLAGRLRAVPEGETPPPGRMALIVAGLLLVLLLLGAFGYAAWTIVLSSPDPEADVAELIADKPADEGPLPIVMPASEPAEVAAASAPVGEDAASAVAAAEPHEEQPVSSVAEAEPAAEPPAPPPPLTEVEALRRKNAELQAELDALRKSQRSSAAVKLYPGGGGAPAGGVATVGSSDPAAVAATLKEAIEAMNNGINYQKTPAKTGTHKE